MKCPPLLWTTNAALGFSFDAGPEACSPHAVIIHPKIASAATTHFNLLFMSPPCLCVARQSHERHPDSQLNRDDAFPILCLCLRRCDGSSQFNSGALRIFIRVPLMPQAFAYHFKAGIFHQCIHYFYALPAPAVAAECGSFLLFKL